MHLAEFLSALSRGRVFEPGSHKLIQAEIDIASTDRICVQSMDNLTKNSQALVDCCRLRHPGRIVPRELDDYSYIQTIIRFNSNLMLTLLFSDPARSTRLIFPVKTGTSSIRVMIYSRSTYPSVLLSHALKL